MLLIYSDIRSYEGSVIEDFVSGTVGLENGGEYRYVGLCENLQRPPLQSLSNLTEKKRSHFRAAKQAFLLGLNLMSYTVV